MPTRKWTYYSKAFVADRVKPEHAVWPWSGHRRFAYDFVRWLRPARIAELGVHWGTSFFTFAQAVRDGKMDTEVIGVDTFAGDEQAGRYGEEVWDTVNSLVRRSFARQRITLHRMFFSEARAHVEVASCDLIHIDGLHTYEAVKEDFETWLPKLRENGVMFFHDIAPDTGYGSTTFWGELTRAYPGFAFEHSWGLGVLFPKGDAVLEDLKQIGLDDKIQLYRYRAEAERSRIEKADLGRMAVQRFEAIQEQSRIIAERTRHARTLGDRLEALDKELVEAKRRAVESQAAAKSKGEQVTSLTERVEKVRTERDAAQSLARERFDIMQRMGAKIGELNSERSALTQSVTKLQESAGKAEKTIGEQGKRLAALTAQYESAANMARERHAVMQQQGVRIASLESAVRDLRSRADAACEQIVSLRGAIAESESKRRVAEARNKELNAMIEKLTDRIAEIEADIELLMIRADHADQAIVDQRRESEELRERVESIDSPVAGGVR